MYHLKTNIIHKLSLVLCLVLSAQLARPQDIDGSYAKALHKKYPSVKSEFCTSCKLWVNPYFKSIADTAAHMPLVTYYVYTLEHRQAQEALDIPRSGIPAAWNPGYGQPNETKVYAAANKLIGKPHSAYMIAKGHCQAWILMAWCLDAAILSDTYTFNAAMEYQGQNVGTELATEEECRSLTGYRATAKTDSVKIWCGTWGKQQVYTQLQLAVTVPAYYYKIICYRDLSSRKQVMECYWMPNDPLQTKAQLPNCKIEFAALVTKLGFDPTVLLN